MGVCVKIQAIYFYMFFKFVSSSLVQAIGSYLEVQILKHLAEMGQKPFVTTIFLSQQVYAGSLTKLFRRMRKVANQLERGF